MRVMAIDYGTRKIGVAFSDPTGSFVSRTLTFRSNSEKKAVEKLSALARENMVAKIILGFPISENGTMGSIAKKVELFGQNLQDALNIEVLLSDETYTSEEAKKYLHLRGAKIKGHKEKLDAISAALILDDYLRHQGGTEMG